jgi:ParB family transcriptional regulator, chromosome partitioning protein
MTAKKTGLGRGLEALLGPTASRPVAGFPVAADEELVKLPLDLLQRGAYQPRIDMRADSLAELAESIKSQGVIQPIIVRALPRGPGASARYEIIAGERRWRAAQLAGLSEIPAVVRRVDDRTAIAMALIENIQRENLNPLEEARALDRLIREFSLTHQDAAAAVGRSRAAVSNILRLLELPDEVKGLLERRELEMGHARALLGLEGRRQQGEVALLIARKALSVRETEALVRRLQRPRPERDEAEPDADVRRLEMDLAEKLGARVTVKHQPNGRGQLIVSFSSLDELEGILAHIH